MRPSLALVPMAPLAALAFAFASAGCASTLGSSSGQDRVVVAVDAPVTHGSNEVVEVTEVVPPVVVDTAPPRRRLSQTVTLGSTEPVYAVPPPQQGSGGNVVVNNNVTVVNGMPGYGAYGAYGGYGYGGYGGYGYGGPSRGDGRGSASRSSTTGGYAPTGWEGAQRTAAPGRTPGVGGNWAPAPSFGPKALR